MWFIQKVGMSMCVLFGEETCVVWSKKEGVMMRVGEKGRVMMVCGEVGVCWVMA